MPESVVAKLIHASNMSLDGCTEDERGAFDWAPPDDDVFVFIMRSAGTYLYGRRMYETLALWETDATLADQSNLTADYASAWQAADKVVYSSTVAAPRTANTRLERHFDPSAVRDVKAAASRDLLVGGPNLAAQALVAGLVDELALFVWPVVLGGPHPRIADERARRSEAHRRAPVQQRRRPPPLSSSVTTQGSPAVAHLPSTAGSRALGGYSDPTLGRHTHFRPQRDG